MEAVAIIATPSVGVREVRTNLTKRSTGNRARFARDLPFGMLSLSPRTRGPNEFHPHDLKREEDILVIRNWRNVTPVVGHESKLIWSIFRAQSAEGLDENEAVLLGFSGLTLHRLQGGLEGDYHEHEATEQVYYFLSGTGRMKIDGEMYDVREGDAVHIPPKVKHQLSNTGDDWVEHLIISAQVAG